MTTIQPGILFSRNAVAFARLAYLSDDDIAAHVDAVERGTESPAELLARYLATYSGHRGWPKFVRSYVRAVCVCAGVELVAGI